MPISKVHKVTHYGRTGRIAGLFFPIESEVIDVLRNLYRRAVLYREHDRS